MLDVLKNPYELSYDMFEIFINNLKTVDNKNVAIHLSMDKVKKLQNELKNIKDSNSKFYLIEDINYYVIYITNIYFVLYNVEQGIDYFHKNYIEEKKKLRNMSY